MLSPHKRKAVIAEFAWFTRQARAPRIRPLRQFAEEEIVVPEGKHELTRFSCRTLPWTGLLYDEIDSGRWNRVVATGNVQGGKTLCVYLIPLLWHLFEHQERVIAGVPDLKTAADKWLKEFLPTIRAQARFERYLPDRGRGSKGGFTGSILLGNGAELRFMIGGGGDENRSNVTSRVAACTEADRLDAIGESAREASPIYQIEARTASFAHNARLYHECTVTTESGYVWREIQASTASRIVCPCVHCGAWVSPEREHFVGVEECESELHAEESGRFRCPDCAALYDDDERRQMNLDGRLLHRGQTIDEQGRIHGEPPPSRTLGFRWSAFNNLLWPSSFIAAQAYRAMHDRDLESAERKMRQWYWVLPLEPNELDMTPLSAEDVRGRATGHTRGVLPSGTTIVTAAIDCRKTQLHFEVWAYNGAGRGVLVDIGVAAVDAKTHGVRKALRLTLRELSKRLDAGYPRAENLSVRLAPGRVPIDAGYFPDVVRAFVREKQSEGIRRYMPSFGRGQSQNTGTRQYRQPDAQSPQKPFVGEQYYVSFQAKHQSYALVINADYWKSYGHEGLATPVDEPGALVLFEPTTEDERRLLEQFARQVTSERCKEVFVPGRGPVLVWENESRRANHFLDVFYLAQAAAHMSGVRIVDANVVHQVEAPAAALGVEGPGGMPYLITERDAV